MVYAQEAHKGGFRAHTVGGGGAGEQRILITLLGLLRCIKELNHPAPPLLFSPSTLLILTLQLGPLASPPPTPHPPPPRPELIRNQQQTVRCIKDAQPQPRILKV